MQYCFFFITSILFLSYYVRVSSDNYTLVTESIEKDVGILKETSGIEGYGFLGKYKKITYADDTDSINEYTLFVEGKVKNIWVHIKLKENSEGIWEIKSLKQTDFFSLWAD